MRKGHSSKQSEKISNESADVNDQIGRDWQRESEAELPPFGNHYIRLRLFSHHFAGIARTFSIICPIKRFTLVTCITSGKHSPL
jgi:hypothetical protein